MLLDLQDPHMLEHFLKFHFYLDSQRNVPALEAKNFEVIAGDSASRKIDFYRSVYQLLIAQSIYSLSRLQLIVFVTGSARIPHVSTSLIVL